MPWLVPGGAARPGRVPHPPDLEISMRTPTRLAATAGLTVLGCTAMTGVAQADTGGFDPTGLTAPVVKSVTGTVNHTTRVLPERHSGGSGPSLHLPADLNVALPAARTGGRSGVSAGVHAGVGASPKGVHAHAALRLCAGDCGGSVPSPTPQPPPAPPTPPPAPAPPGSNPPPPVAKPPAVNAPAAVHDVLARALPSALPYTGGPIGTLIFLAAIALTAGTAAIVVARPRTRLGS